MKRFVNQRILYLVIFFIFFSSGFIPSNEIMQKQAFELVSISRVFSTLSAPFNSISSMGSSEPPVGFMNILNIASISSNGKLQFFFSALLLLLSSFFLLSQFKIRIIPAFIIGLYLILIAQIVLIFEIASLFTLVSSKPFFIILSSFILAVSISFWFIQHRPHLLLPFKDKTRMLSLFSEFLGSIKRYPFIWFLGLGVLSAFAFAFYLNIYFPQNMDDILTTHLARVGFWLQSGSFFPWKTITYHLPQVISPANAQILILWTVLFYGGDQLAALTQWSSGIIAIFAVYGICRTLNQSKPRAIFCGFLFITMPVVVLQLSKALTDLLSTTLFISSSYLLFWGWKNNYKGALILSSLAFGLSLGTKQTIFFTGPGMIITLLSLFIFVKEDRVKKLLTWSISGIGFFLLVGSYFYIQNFFVFGEFLGPDEVADKYTQTIGMTLFDQIGMGFNNSRRFLLLSLFSEFQSLLFYFGQTEILYHLINETDYFNNPLGAGIGTAGPIIFVLAILSSGIAIRKWKSDKDPLKLSLMSIGIAFLLILLFIRQFSSALFRYSMITYATLIPLIGLIDFGYFKNGRKIVDQFLFALITFFVIIVMSWSMVADGSSSVLTNGFRPGLDRTYKQTLIKPQYYGPLKMVEDFVPQDASLGLITADKFLISPLFGKYYSRSLYLMIPEKDGSIKWSDYPKAQYLLLYSKLLMKGLTIPEGYEELSNSGGFKLYQRTEGNGQK